MPYPTRCWLLLTASWILCGCHYKPELHRVTQERKLYDDLCARGQNVWRMYYEGTDSTYHRFLVNDMDRWRHVRISRSELVMEEIPTTDTTQRYYCVDPCKGWIRVDGSCWLGSAGR